METADVRLPELSFSLRWEHPPESWAYVDGTDPAAGAARDHAAPRLTGTGLHITTGGQSDLFVDPHGAAPMLNAPRLIGALDGDFQLQARVEVDFKADFDAGVLVVWVDETNWAKLCFEISPQGQPMVVSVVTRGVSDDANCFDVSTPTVELRISRLGGGYAFHARGDEGAWRFVRSFALAAPPDAGARIGFEAQSPRGNGCSVCFSDISCAPVRLADLRDGR